MDAVFHFARLRIPVIHLAGATISALFLWLYARLVAATTRFVRAGQVDWRRVAGPGVVTVWHGCSPSLLVAIVAGILPTRVSILIAGDPRGDCLSLLCKWLGLAVVRGDGDGKGWQALAQLSKMIEQGASVVITPDGGGKAREARVGAVALAAATAIPLFAAGADCRPALFERHKWDKARNPVPFGRVAIVMEEVLLPADIEDAKTLEKTRLELQRALDSAAETASLTLQGKRLTESAATTAKRRMPQ